MATHRHTSARRANSSTRLPRTVIVVGLVSLLNDFASEMVVPLIPIMLATVLAAGPVALGAIEGSADAVSNLVKLWAGRNSDVIGRRRKPYVVLGYLLSNIVRPLIGLSTHWGMVLGIRVTDRIGKGLRTAPRDAMIADAVAEGSAGRAFGFARALDHAGAVIGALAAAAVVQWGTHSLETVIALSAIPGSLAVALIAFGVREPASGIMQGVGTAPLRWNSLTTDARHFLTTASLFALGRIPETFLLLRGHELGLGTVALLLLWATLHAFKSVLSEFAGRLADRLGRRPLIVAGWSLYVVALTTLAFAEHARGFMTGGFILAGYFGLSEGAERALMRDLAPVEERGTAFGWYHMLTGFAAIPAGLTLGSLWALIGVKAAFLTSAVVAGGATGLLWSIMPRAGRPDSS
ncbi:MAG: MFS transporter [Acidiferrobacterales bacterium]